jgi:VWFA-related protein
MKALASVGAMAIVWAAHVLSGQQTAPTFRATTDAVTVPVEVRDRNRPITGLRAEDFVLIDNGVPQSIGAVSIASVPIDVTLVLDTSGSVAGQALNQFKADVQTMSDLLSTSDRIRLLTFAATVSDVFGLRPAGGRLPLESISSGGLTALYNALAAALITVSTSDRPQLVLALSDGIDSVSFLDADHLASLAPLSSASLYVVLADSTASTEAQVIHNGPGDSALVFKTHGHYAGGPNRGALRTAAERTGGSVYDRLPGESLPAVFRKILDDFRTGYVLAYSPVGVSRTGWHDIQVHCRNSAYSVRARAGYDGGR